MTDLLHDVDAPSDAELISRVRGGDVAAYGELFSRHVDAAKRLSRQLVRGPDADDLVSEAFAKVLTVLQGGGGPDVAFRAYLLTSVRRLHVDRIRAGSRLQTSDDMEAFDPGVPFQDTAVAAFESGAAAKAFASLPERWQLVLWHLEVEGQKPADVAPLLGMSPNSVSALAYRAREGLRQAFLTMHLNDISETDCRWVNEHLGAYVRNGLAKRESTKVQSHLDECRRCTAMYLELTEVNSDLRGIIGPLLLGAAATGYLASSGTAAGGLGITAVFGRVRDTISANAGAATIGAVAAGVAAVATAGIMLLPSSGPDKVVGADQPIGTVSTPGQPAGLRDGEARRRQDGRARPHRRTWRRSARRRSSPRSCPARPSSPVCRSSRTPLTSPREPTRAGPAPTRAGPAPATVRRTRPSRRPRTRARPSPTRPSRPRPSRARPSRARPSPARPSPARPSPARPSPARPSRARPTGPEPAAGDLQGRRRSRRRSRTARSASTSPATRSSRRRFAGPPVRARRRHVRQRRHLHGPRRRRHHRRLRHHAARPRSPPLPFARTMLAEPIQSFQITMPLCGHAPEGHAWSRSRCATTRASSSPQHTGPLRRHGPGGHRRRRPRRLPDGGHARRTCTTTSSPAPSPASRRYTARDVVLTHRRAPTAVGHRFAGGGTRARTGRSASRPDVRRSRPVSLHPAVLRPGQPHRGHLGDHHGGRAPSRSGRPADRERLRDRLLKRDARRPSTLALSTPASDPRHPARPRTRSCDRRRGTAR